MYITISNTYTSYDSTLYLYHPTQLPRLSMIAYYALLLAYMIEDNRIINFLSLVAVITLYVDDFLLGCM